MKSFRDWSRQDIADEFGLGIRRDCDELNSWLDVTDIDLSVEEKTTLDKLREKLTNYVDIWNEQELIIKFISFIIGLVDYDTETYKSFANRKLRSLVEGKEISGEVDLMIAKGEFEPKSPYFCLHEYKRVDNDPHWSQAYENKRNWSDASRSDQKWSQGDPTTRWGLSL